MDPESPAFVIAMQAVTWHHGTLARARGAFRVDRAQSALGREVSLKAPSKVQLRVFFDEPTPVCTFKTYPCVPAKRPHLSNMWTCCRYTREAFPTLHTARNTRQHTATHGYTQQHATTYNNAMSSQMNLTCSTWWNHFTG